jgi:hypothetical protein
MHNTNLRDHLHSCRTIGNPIVNHHYLTIHSRHHPNFTNIRCSISSSTDLLIQGLPSVHPSIKGILIPLLSLVSRSRDPQLRYLMLESLKNRIEACFRHCDPMRHPQPHQIRSSPHNQPQRKFTKSHLRRLRLVITSTTTRSGGINYDISKGWTLIAWICRAG